MPPTDQNAPAVSGIEGNAVLITGAASGIGRATCLLFARHGAAIVAADANAEGLAQLRVDLGESGSQVSTFVFDAGDPAQCAGLVAEAARQRQPALVRLGPALDEQHLQRVVGDREDRDVDGDREDRVVARVDHAST